MTSTTTNCSTCDAEIGIPLVSGRSANPGCVTGRVAIMMDPRTANGVPDDAILVTPMTDPDCVPAMQRAAAIVTDRGGLLCHAAIVSRELDKPCIVGSKTASEVLVPGALVRVCATSGTVYELKPSPPQ